MKERVMEQMKHTFRPEFLNRIDEMIVFQSLTDAQLQEIVDLLLKDLVNRIEENGFDLELTPGARELILKEGYDPAYGARPLKRAIQKLVEDAISEEILKKTVEPGDSILVDVSDNKIVVGKK
jgi:ATP-dependent Clp protease ATP-binding subunit ClpC